MKVQWNKASMKQRNWSKTLSSKLAGEIDWSINRLIRGKEKGRLKNGLTESGSTVWEEWTAVDRINGKCTKNIEEIRNDGNGIDQLPLSHLYFNSRLQNARVCDLFHSGRHTHEHRPTHTWEASQHQCITERGFFISDWAVRTQSPKDTHSSSGWCCYLLTRLLSACGDNVQFPTRCMS